MASPTAIRVGVQVRRYSFFPFYLFIRVSDGVSLFFSTVLLTHLAAAESRCVKLERQLDHMRRMLRSAKADRSSMLKQQVSPACLNVTSGCDIDADEKKKKHQKLHMHECLELH